MSGYPDQPLKLSTAALTPTQLGLARRLGIPPHHYASMLRSVGDYGWNLDKEYMSWLSEGWSDVDLESRYVHETMVLKFNITEEFIEDAIHGMRKCP